MDLQASQYVDKLRLGNFQLLSEHEVLKRGKCKRGRREREKREKMRTRLSLGERPAL